ncbi:MAG TPA: hypothetical protein VHZ27_13005, partial [Solirubrobacteraceae bacterium]|nr:hypothetical protein [Solirubrobacteraceae bacterium]
MFLAYCGGMFLDPRHRLQIAEVHADARRRDGAKHRPSRPGSARDGAVVADPFHRTAQLVTLLQTRAEQLLRDDRPGSRRWFARVRSRLA